MPPQLLYSCNKLLRGSSPTFTHGPSSFIVVIPTDNTYGRVLTWVFPQNSSGQHMNVLYSMTLRCDRKWRSIKWLDPSFLSSLLHLFVRVYFARDSVFCDQPLNTRKRCNEDLSMWLLPLGPSLHSGTSQAKWCPTLTSEIRNKA